MALDKLSLCLGDQQAVLTVEADLVAKGNLEFHSASR